MVFPALSAQVVLITGASSGIGAAIALDLSQKFPGIKLVLAARSQEKLDSIATQCQQQGAEVLVIPTDVAVVDQVKSLAEKALQHFGRVDALVNNAGYGQMGPMELISAADAQYQFAVNFYAPLTLSQALIPTMRQQGYGKIINISSVAGRVAFPLMGVYSASKFALEAMSDALRMELEPFNIQVVLIEPGPVKTEFFNVAKETVEKITPLVEGSPYQAAFAEVAGMEEGISKVGWDVDRLAQVVTKALSSSKPQPRYVAATGGNVMLFLMTKLFPTRIVDKIWQGMYGIDKIKPALESNTKFKKG
jgi:short-subunit dehydrogenase